MDLGRFNCSRREGRCAGWYQATAAWTLGRSRPWPYETRGEPNLRPMTALIGPGTFGVIPEALRRPHHLIRQVGTAGWAHPQSSSWSRPAARIHPDKRGKTDPCWKALEQSKLRQSRCRERHASGAIWSCTPNCASLYNLSVRGKPTKRKKKKKSC